MWFCAPLQHGILPFGGSRHPKSEESPMKNRVREQTPSDASFFSVLGPRGGQRDRKGSRKGAPRHPRDTPKRSQNRCQNRTFERYASKRWLIRFTDKNHWFWHTFAQHEVQKRAQNGLKIILKTGSVSDRTFKLKNLRK